MTSAMSPYSSRMSYTFVSFVIVIVSPSGKRSASCNQRRDQPSAALCKIPATPVEPPFADDESNATEQERRKRVRIGGSLGRGASPCDGLRPRARAHHGERGRQPLLVLCEQLTDHRLEFRVGRRELVEKDDRRERRALGEQRE